jgi:hypothetical protein
MSIPAQFDIYSDVWQEDHNARKLIHGISRDMSNGRSVIITLQPGDGTRYAFLLAPIPNGYDVSSDGRQYDAPRNDGILYVTRADHASNATSVLTFGRGSTLEHIRWRITGAQSFENPCTVEALAQTIYHIWGEGAMT